MTHQHTNGARPLAGKVALVTGAGRGIGRAIAQRLARDGALVAVHYGNSREAAARTVAEIEAAGGQAFAVGADLSGAGLVGQIGTLFASLDAELNRRTGSTEFDILVNNAGIAPATAVGTATEADFDTVFDVNVKAPFFIAQRALPRLRNGGRVVNISSVVSRIAFPAFTGYSMTKGALDVLTRNLAEELGPRGITVNSVNPGVTKTDMADALFTDDSAWQYAASMSPLGRVGAPEDIADAVGFLVSNDGRWVTGQMLDASGGMALTAGTHAVASEEAALSAVA